MGVALEVEIKADAKEGGGAAGAPVARRSGKAGKRNTVFLEDLLFTHRGLSGPAVLQISSYWNPGDAIVIDLAPGQNLEKGLLAPKAGRGKQLGSVLAGVWPNPLAAPWPATFQARARGLVS